MEPFATLEELTKRLDWTLDADEERTAEGALEDASDMARHYGRDWPDAASAPRMVRTLVLKACKRHMNNVGGYNQSRAGDETLGWNDAQGENAGTVYFTDDEIKVLRSLAGKGSGFVSVETTAYGTKLRDTTGYVPTGNPDEKPFPMFSDPVSPW